MLAHSLILLQPVLVESRFSLYVLYWRHTRKSRTDKKLGSSILSKIIFFINSFRGFNNQSISLHHSRSFAGEKKEAKAELNLNDFPGHHIINSNQYSVTIQRREVWQPLIKFSFLSYDPNLVPRAIPLKNPFFKGTALGTRLIWPCGWRKEKPLDGWMHFLTYEFPRNKSN